MGSQLNQVFRNDRFSTGLCVIFRSPLHTLPRNSGVVQTSLDRGISEVPCTNRHFSEVVCTKQQRLLRRSPRSDCCRHPPIEGGHGDSEGVRTIGTAVGAKHVIVVPGCGSSGAGEVEDARGGRSLRACVVQKQTALRWGTRDHWLLTDPAFWPRWR